MNCRFHPPFLVPLKNKKTFTEWGVDRVIEMDWWQSVTWNGLEIVCTPARHFSSRSPWDRDETLWASWYLKEKHTGVTLYFAGDTGYGPHFRRIRKRLGAPLIALLPIGAYLPRWLMEEMHVTPEEALEAFLDLKASYMIPIHWGTFDLADEPFHEPPRRLRKAMKRRGVTEESVRLLPVGGVFEIPPEKGLSARRDPVE